MPSLDDDDNDYVQPELIESSDETNLAGKTSQSSLNGSHDILSEFLIFKKRDGGDIQLESNKNEKDYCVSAGGTAKKEFIENRAGKFAKKLPVKSNDNYIHRAHQINSKLERGRPRICIKLIRVNSSYKCCIPIEIEHGVKECCVLTPKLTVKSCVSFSNKF